MTTPLSDEDLRRIHRAVLEHASDFLFFTNPEGVILWSNPANARRLGYGGPDDLVGTRAIDLYVNPRARRDMLKELLAGGHSQAFVAQIRTRSGDPFYAEITCDVVRDDAGRIVGIVGVARDVSDRQSLAEDLRRLQEFNETVLNTIPTALWTVDLEGTITWTNGALCRLMGCPVSDLVDRNVFRDAPAWTAPIRDCIAVTLDRGIVCRSKAVENRLPDGRIVYLDITILPLREEGELAGALAEAIDVTERVELQQELTRLKAGRQEEIH
jgi:PAS domain S-box-containing protein